MAKTLVALYVTVAEAEQVIHDLVQHGFARSDMHLITHGGADRHPTAPHAERLAGEDQITWLTDHGVPEDEARAYAEGVRQGEALIVVHASDSEAERGMEIMNRRRLAEAHAQHAAQAQPTAAGRRAPRQQGPEQETTIPVVEEELAVGTRQVERGTVRIHTRVTEHPVEETVRVREEKVTVERHPVNRPATVADLAAATERTIEVIETIEEPVVSKRARVIEEVTIHKETREHTETVRDTVRRQDVEIDQGEASQARDVRGFETMMPASGGTSPTLPSSLGDVRHVYAGVPLWLVSQRSRCPSARGMSRDRRALTAERAIAAGATWMGAVPGRECVTTTNERTRPSRARGVRSSMMLQRRATSKGRTARRILRDACGVWPGSADCGVVLLGVDWGPTGAAWFWPGPAHRAGPGRGQPPVVCGSGRSSFCTGCGKPTRAIRPLTKQYSMSRTSWGSFSIGVWRWRRCARCCGLSSPKWPKPFPGKT